MSAPTPDPAPGGPRSLLPPDWADLEPLLDAVLDAPSDARAARIVELCAGDPRRAEALAHLLAECDRDSPLLDRPAADRFDMLAGEELRGLPPGLLAARYEVGRELGRGGMARVYIARDLKHGRDVAIKVIRPELAASLGHDRFLREIEIAARLNHPNIMTLLDSGEVAGTLYFVMPYEEGPSLGRRLAEGGTLPLPEALSVLRDLARALAYAHEHGIVHRDVKPDNVMLSSGTAVVTDFGIARAVSAARADGAGAVISGSGAVLGTPAYMAPEQATGDPATDPRADIYSFGCLAYEIFAGAPPFPDESVALVLAAHLAMVPQPVASLRSDVPSGVSELIARCLEKDPARRPQSAREVLAVLETVSPGGFPVGAPAPRRAAQLRRWTLGALGLGVVGILAYLLSRPPEPISVAVLPFGNAGADSTMNDVAEALSDEVAGALTRVPGIEIRSRTGARAYRGMLGIDVTEAGTRLNADYVLTGVVRQERGHWILSADLAHAADATSLWDHSFDLGQEQQAGSADVIADSLTAGLRGLFPNVVGSAPRYTADRHTPNNEAFRLYLRAQALLDRRGQSIREIAELFREAVQQDTLYARAWSGLSLALAFFPIYQAASATAVHDELVHAAGQALALDPSLAQPHVALGMAYGFRFQWDSASVELRTAVGLDGHDVEARSQLARLLRNRGRLAEAMIELRKARAEDPASAVALGQMSYGFYLDGQLDSALFESRRALQNDSAYLGGIGIGGLIRLANHLPGEARALVDRARTVGPIVAYVIAKSGDTARARRRLRELDTLRPVPPMAETSRAYIHLGLGDTAQALSALERATAGGEIWLAVESYLDPMYDPIRRSARFQAILHRARLTP